MRNGGQTIDHELARLFCEKRESTCAWYLVSAISYMQHLSYYWRLQISVLISLTVHLSHEEMGLNIAAAARRGEDADTCIAECQKRNLKTLVKTRTLGGQDTDPPQLHNLQYYILETHHTSKCLSTICLKARYAFNPREGHVVRFRL
jgi:hypothetical protein